MHPLGETNALWDDSITKSCFIGRFAVLGDRQGLIIIGLMMPLQFKPPIYHITHLDNLARIIRTNGLWCDGERVRLGFDSVGIAHASLKTRRSQTPVPVAAEGTLNDYVPFYFAVRSPMLYSIHTGFVEGYDGGQKRVIYLVSSMEQVEKGDRKWCFTDGHAVESFTRFFDDRDKIDKIN
jgi:hypothetical protein